MTITSEQYKEAVGVDPKDDDLERCNCEKAGEVGHWSCGWDKITNLPVFLSGAFKVE